MPIVATDIKVRLSTTAGSAGDTTAQSDPNASLGKWASTTAISTTTLNNLFDNVTVDESAAGDTEYRCFFIYNNHATDVLQNVKVWIDSQVLTGATVEIGLDTTAASDIDSGTQQALQVANENTAPAGVTFSAANQAVPLTIGNLPADFCKAIWLKRTVPSNSPSKALDGVTIKIQGETS